MDQIRNHKLKPSSSRQTGASPLALSPAPAVLPVRLPPMGSSGTRDRVGNGAMSLQNALADKLAERRKLMVDDDDENDEFDHWK